MPKAETSTHLELASTESAATSKQVAARLLDQSVLHGGSAAKANTCCRCYQEGRRLEANYKCFAVVGPVGGSVAVSSFSRLQGAILPPFLYV